jgi:flagellin-like protein
MGNRILKNNKGQSPLETAAVFVLMVLLIGGITNIWLWANNQIIARQLRYNDTRITAGTSADGYILVWPVYTPPELTENMVLIGD